LSRHSRERIDLSTIDVRHGWSNQRRRSDIMRYRVQIEHQLSQGLYRSLVPFGSVLAEHLQGRLGTAARVLPAVEEGDQQQPVIVAYDLGGEGRFDSHEQLVEFVAAAMHEAGLYAVRAVVSEIIRHYVTGAAVSGTTALLCTKNANPWVTLVATAIAAAAGALTGGSIEQEVARFEARRQPYGVWVWYQLVPIQTFWRSADTA
jgi:hypothetical protein